MTVRTPFLTIAALAMAMTASAQSALVPEKPAVPLAKGNYDGAHAKDRPYGANLPKPIFPSTPRVQKEFAVRYIYDYAISTYAPPVTLPKVNRAQADKSTPEGALIALVSAMQDGDYDAWLQCWDEDSRKVFTDAAKSGKDAAFWKKQWQAMVMGKNIILVDRLEMTSYVVLDARLASAGKTESATFPSIFKNEKGVWYATNALSTSNMLGNMQPGVAGIDSHVAPEPLARLTGPSAQEADAQQEFIHYHTSLPGVTKAAR